MLQQFSSERPNESTGRLPSKSKNDCVKCLAKLTQDSIPVSKFDNEQVNHSLGKEKGLSESSRNWLEVIHLESVSKLVFFVVAII